MQNTNKIIQKITKLFCKPKNFSLIILLVLFVFTYYILSYGLLISIAFAVIFSLIIYNTMMLFNIIGSLKLQKFKTKELEKRIIGAGTSNWFDREINPIIALPIYQGWELHPETRSFLYKDLVDKKPTNVLEIGTGISTLIIAYALEKNDSGFIYSIEQDDTFAEYSRKLLKAHKLEHRAKIITINLINHDLAKWIGLWYDGVKINEAIPKNELIDYM